MIVASPKSVTELKQLIDRHQKVLFVGCGTCVTVCLAGGEREVGIAGYGVAHGAQTGQAAGGDRADHHRAPVRQRIHQGSGARS
jgi:ferredoxin